jgi:type IV fimbrial biogenesis protein FimT
MLTRAATLSRSAGFNLLELMMVLTILAVLMVVGMPSFRTLMRNYEVRVAAESVANGLQRARAEAVSRNAAVEFALGTGTSWDVRLAGGGASIESRSSAEGSANAVLTAVAADFATAATTITYNSLGQVIANADASQTLRRVSFNATAAGGDQNLRVAIGAGGNARVCDPSLPVSNVRACQAGE